MKTRVLWQWALVLLFLVGCVASKTYFVDVRYIPQTPPKFETQPVTIAVAPFVDSRGQNGSVGLRQKLDGSVDRYTTGSTGLGLVVRKVVKRFLRQNKLNAIDIQEWDLKAESLTGIDTDFVVGGEINRLWSQADSLAGRTVINTEADVTVYLGKPQQGEVFQQRIQVGQEVTKVIFSTEMIEEAINEALSEIIEDAFKQLLERAGA
jgi:hypothetical protein